MAYQLPELPYEFSALEPYIDAQTMEIHYTKHHQAYVNKLNEALEGSEELQNLTILEILSDLEKVSEDKRDAVRNNGGGHYNHSLFWQLMSPGEIKPSPTLEQMLSEPFGSLDDFKSKFAAEAAGRFGSGWAWLVIDNGELKVTSTPNQDNPVMEGMTPILGLDVWEHAYYLKYQNKRPEYIQNWWNVVNWNKVEESLMAALNEQN